MAHFAELDENNIVLRVTVVSNNVLLDENGIEQESLGLKHLEHLGGRWVQTSYNGNFRKNYAGIGYLYDPIRDVFIPPKPFNSWIFNEENCRWDPPYFPPGDNNLYSWNEDLQSWELTL
jgi:hypothetical protein